MDTNLGGILILAILLVVVPLTSHILNSSHTLTGNAIRASSEPVGERARTVLADLTGDDLIATGKRVSLNIQNTGLTSVSDFDHVDVIVEYQSNETGVMVYQRLTYATSTTITNSQPIALDTVSTNSTTSEASTLTFAHTVGHHSNRMLIVGTQGEDASRGDCEVTGVTYDSKSLTRVDEAVAGTTTFVCASMWYLLSPDTGTHNVVITWNGNVSDRSGGATSIYNAAQQGPETQASQTFNSDTTIYLLYGNGSIATSQEDVPGTWANNYEAVLHLQESGSGNDDEFQDSTDNNHHGTGGGIAGAGSGARTPAQTAGKFGFAQDFTSSTDDNIRLDAVGDQAWTAVTVQCWINPNAQDDAAIFGKTFGSNPGDNVWFLGKDQDARVRHRTNSTSDVHDGGNVFATSSWSHFAYTWDAGASGAIRVYQNGVQTMSPSTAGSDLFDNSTEPTIGNDPNFTRGFDGLVQECRLSDVVRSGDWLLTEYDSQDDPSTFYEIGSSEPLSGDYSFRRGITIPGANVSGSATLSEFPLFVSGTYSYLATTGNGGDVQDANGFDIIFTGDQDGTTQLDHEIMSYSATTGAVNMWVEVPSLLGADAASPSTTSVTTTTDGAWLIDVIGSGSSGGGFTPTAGTDQLERYDLQGTNSAAAGSTRHIATATSTSMSWSQSGNLMAHVVAAFAPAVPPLTSQWWDTNYNHRQQLTVTTGSNSPSGGYDGYTVRLTNFDTAALVLAGKMRSDCNDLRVLWQNTASSWTEVDRHIITCDDAATDLRFQLQVTLGDNDTTQDYYIYYGNITAPAGPADLTNVYLWYDSASADQLSSYTLGRGDDWHGTGGGDTFAWNAGGYYTYDTGNDVTNSLRYAVNERDVYIEVEFYHTNAYPTDMTSGVVARYQLGSGSGSSESADHYYASVREDSPSQGSAGYAEDVSIVKTNRSTVAIGPADGASAPAIVEDQYRKQAIAIWGINSTNGKFWDNDTAASMGPVGYPSQTVTKSGTDATDYEGAGDAGVIVAQGAARVRNILIRRYTEAEPSVSNGSEENVPSAAVLSSLAGMEWTNFYRAVDDFEPGTWDPGEVQTIRMVLNPRQESGTTGRITVSTPNGVTVTELFSRPEWLALSDTPDTVHYSGGLASDGSYLYAVRGATTTDFWLYDIRDEIDLVDDSWTPLADTIATVEEGGALVYGEDGGTGYIYALRGGDTNDFWRYDIAGNSWGAMDNTPAAASYGGALAWDGSNLIYGLRGASTTDFWQYSISGDSWTPRAATPSAVREGGALVYTSGDPYAFGGNGTTTFWRYNSSPNNWTPLADAPAAVGEGGDLTWESGDYIYGWAGNGTTAAWRYSISGDSWEVLADTPAAVGEGGDLVFLDSDIYALSGGLQDDFWTYQPRGY